MRDIKNIFEQQKEDYGKPVKFSNFYSNSYIEYKGTGDKNKTLSKNTLMESNYTQKISSITSKNLIYESLIRILYLF